MFSAPIAYTWSFHMLLGLGGWCGAGQQFAQLKWADSLDGLVDLSTRLHSMSALAHVPASIRCRIFGAMHSAFIFL